MEKSLISNKLKYLCKICARRFGSKATLKKHICLFHCGCCKSSLEHYLKLRSERKINIYICQDCQNKRIVTDDPAHSLNTPICDKCILEQDPCYHLVQQYCFCQDCGCWFREMVLPEAKRPTICTAKDNKLLLALLFLFIFIAVVYFVIKRFLL